MIFSLTDEMYSVLCGCKTVDPEETHRDSWFLISAIDHVYWVLGSVIGGLLGNIIPFDLTGIDFSMTALFVVILLEKVLGATKQIKMAATVGGVVSTVFLLLLGIEKFLLPSLLITVFILSAACAGDRAMPPFIKKVADLLPATIMAVLVIYCSKGDIVDFSMGTVATGISVIVVVLLHLWKRNILLSIGNIYD